MAGDLIQKILNSQRASTVCLARQVGAIERPPRDPWMSHRLENEASVEADY